MEQAYTVQHFSAEKKSEQPGFMVIVDTKSQADALRFIEEKLAAFYQTFDREVIDNKSTKDGKKRHYTVHSWPQINAQYTVDKDGHQTQKIQKGESDLEFRISVEHVGGRETHQYQNDLDSPQAPLKTMQQVLRLYFNSTNPDEKRAERESLRHRDVVYNHLKPK